MDFESVNKSTLICFYVPDHVHVTNGEEKTLEHMNEDATIREFVLVWL